MTSEPRTTRLPVLIRAGRASVTTGARLASWANLLGRPSPESHRSRTMAHVGGLAAAVALASYLVWRVLFTLPEGGPDLVAAVLLLPLQGGTPHRPGLP